MKFAHVLKEALREDGYPQSWVAAAVPYGQLKKCLKKAQKELESIGLDEGTISHLLQQEGEGALALEYEVNGERKLTPKLTLCVQFEDGEVTDVLLSPSTREYLQALAAKQHGASDELLDVDEDDQTPSTHAQSRRPSRASGTAIRVVEVPLAFTAEFFEILYDDVAELEKVQLEQQKNIKSEILELSTEIRKLSRPSKSRFKTSDMYRWRELFDIYLEANIFFSTREIDHGRRSGEIAAQKLGWFQNEINRRGLLQSFRIPQSLVAVQKFLDINLQILLNLKFTDINQRAISKILKKYDKRTMLSAGKTFPVLIKQEAIMSGSVAKDVCAQVTTDLIKLVPQFDDYSCPLCTEITYRPVRMACNHVFCLDCSCKMQNMKRQDCPVCRAHTIMQADAENVDWELGKHIKKNFPMEWREAGIKQQTEDGIKRFGPAYRHPKDGKEYKEPGDCKMM